MSVWIYGEGVTPLFRASCTFRGGIHPHSKKSSTASSSIEKLPAPQKLIIPVLQHLGAPARPVVKAGDKVKAGQLIAEATGFVSACVHASVSGTVSAVGPFPHPSGKASLAIEIENDGAEEKAPPLMLVHPWDQAASGEIVQHIAASGIVGLGGATFPTHVKLSPPPNKPIDTLIINGAECEPYLTTDQRLMMEKCDEILTGTLIVKKVLGARRVFIAVEDNKPQVLALFHEHLSNALYKGSISLARLKTKYPQGGEKQLIAAITRREVPSGGLPMDVGCVVQNVGTVYAIYDAVVNGQPLTQRVITVAGPAVGKPANLLVKIGTPLRHVLEFCAVDLSKTKKIIMGGPMMGIAQIDLDSPVTKATSGLLAMTHTTPADRLYACINCGNCVRACPIHLVPSILVKQIAKERYGDAEAWNVLDCIECGSCTYVCPAKINLVHYLKLGKFVVTAARKKASAVSK